MEIKRTFEMLVTTNRRYTIRRSLSDRHTACEKCGEPMLATEQAAGFFGIKQRWIFQIIETETAHFAEIEAGAVLVCMSSLAKVLDDEVQKNQSLTPN